MAQTLMQYMDKPFQDAAAPDALPESEEEKAEGEKKTEANRPVLDFVKQALGDKVFDVRLSKVLKSGAVCLTTDGPMSLEMEKYFQSVQPDAALKADRILELNVEHPAFAALEEARKTDAEKAKKYAQVLLNQAKLIAGLQIEDPSGYTDLLCSLWS